MMRKLLLALMMLAALCGTAMAQSNSILIVSVCGNQTLQTGTTLGILTVDKTGVLCIGGSSAGYNITVPNIPTVQNAAYSSGNAIGGLQTFAFFRTTAQPSGILNNISVASKGGSTTALTLYIFNSNPSGTTCTDKSAFSLGVADVTKLIATTPPVLTPAVVGAGTTVTTASQQLPVSVKNFDSPATVNLYVCAVVGGTVTPASTTDLVFKIGGVQD